MIRSKLSTSTFELSEPSTIALLAAFMPYLLYHTLYGQYTDFVFAGVQVVAGLTFGIGIIGFYLLYAEDARRGSLWYGVAFRVAIAFGAVGSIILPLSYIV